MGFKFFPQEMWSFHPSYNLTFSPLGVPWTVGCMKKVIWNWGVESLSCSIELHLPKTNVAPENRPGPKRKLVFQLSIFRGYVSFRGGTEWIYDYSLVFQSYLLRGQVLGLLGPSFFGGPVIPHVWCWKPKDWNKNTVWYSSQNLWDPCMVYLPRC